MNDYNDSHNNRIAGIDGSFIAKFKKIKLSSLENAGMYFGGGLIELTSKGIFFSAFQKYPFWRICVHWILLYIALHITQIIILRSALPIISFTLSLWAANSLWVKPAYGFIPYISIKKLSTVSKRQLAGIDFLAKKGVWTLVVHSRDFDKLIAALKLGISEKDKTSPAHLIPSDAGEQYEEFKSRVYSVMQVSDFN